MHGGIFFMATQSEKVAIGNFVFTITKTQQEKHEDTIDIEWVEDDYRNGFYLSSEQAKLLALTINRVRKKK